MTRKEHVTRRRFVKAAAGAIGTPIIVHASTLGAGGAAAPSERITVGGIGVGGRGSGVLRSLAGAGGQAVAACDVQQARRDRAKKAGMDVYSDFRELLARDDIDAVVIASPSHWKPLHTIAAAKAGKDVYCEKPMSLTIRDGRAMVDAVRRYGRVFQHGTQQRSAREFRFACEMVRSGRIGKLKKVTVYVGGPGHECYLPAQPVPKGIDWDLWLGPAPWRPFNARLVATCGGWEGYRDFSGGSLTGWGSHHFDIAQWGLAADETGPVEVIPPDWKKTKGVTFIYADGVPVYQDGSDRTWALMFEGTEGKVAVNRGKLKTAYWLGRTLKYDPAAEQFIGDPGADRFLNRPRRDPWTL